MIRRIVGIALLIVGVVFVAGAAIVKWVAAPDLVKIPPSVNRVTIAAGNSQVFVVAQQAVRTVPVLATRTVTGDKSASTGSVAVYDEVLCLRAANASGADKYGCVPSTDPGFIQRTADRIAFDRKTALAVHDPGRFGTNVDGDKSIAHEGIGYTFPIDTKKRTYPFFDTVVGKAFPMVYQGTDTLHGVHVYRFVQDVPASPIKINGLLPGTYSNTRTVWVEPTTGIIVKGSEQIQQRFTQGNGIAFSGTLTFTDETVASQAKYAKDQLAKVHLIRLWIPLILLVAGLLLMLGGAVSLRWRRRHSRLHT